MSEQATVVDSERIQKLLDPLLEPVRLGSMALPNRFAMAPMTRNMSQVLYVANEGKLLAMVSAADADSVLEAMRANNLGRGARVIGRCVDEHPGMVVAKTGLGGTRGVDLPIGEQLPRIC